MKWEPIIPFEPVTATHVPVGQDWIYQIKWDGVRVLTYFDGNEVKLFNRKRNERTYHYPEITSISTYFHGKSVILDGEVIALDQEGRPSFYEVMRRDGLRNNDKVNMVKEEVPVFYMIFDILYYNGEWIHEKPLAERLELLQKCIIPTEQIQLVPSETDGESLWSVVKSHGLEGMICKKMASTYVFHGKNDSWRKIKNYQDIIAVIAGVTYRSEVVNSVLLGLYDHKGNLWYIGHCGTGKLTQTDWKDLTKKIEPLKIGAMPFINVPERVKGVQWLRPEMTAKINYMEWPKGKTLRQPSLQAFTDIPARHCLLPELPLVKKKKKKRPQVEITHPDKPLWEDPSINKRMYIDYLEQIYPYMEPFLRDRILTVIRYPHGIFGESFYQKNRPEYAPEFVISTEKDGIEYIVCNNIETFLWLGNQLAFEFHIPFQTIREHGPGEIVFDLDPPSRDDFPLAIKAALLLKNELDRLQLKSFVKTSGNKGLQVYIPLPEGCFTYRDTRLFTSFMAQYLVEAEPDCFTIERMKAKRQNRLYIDYVQHAEGKTIIAPFSPRGHPKATVAAPLFWEEVREGLTVETFQLTTMMSRLKQRGNPFAGYFEAKKEQNFAQILQFLQNI